MFKIGFIDYFLSEWHANSYPAWIKECAKNTGEEFEVSYAYAELNVSPYDNITTSEWCAKYGAFECKTIEELCKKSDFIFILAPDNPEKHLEYAYKVFKYGKPVYVDKTFAPDLKTAKEIYTEAKIHNTPFFSSSALGFADEIAGTEKVKNIITTGGANKLDVYIIHQLEMIVKVMKAEKNVTALGSDINTAFYITYQDGRYAALNFGTGFPFAVCIEGDSVDTEKYSFYKTVESPYFINLIQAILKFFLSGKAPVSRQHTLEVIALRDACLKAYKTPGLSVEIEF